MTGPAAGSGTTPAPAAAASQAQGSALPSAEEAYDPGMFVPAPTRDNYVAIVFDQAVLRDVDVEVIRGEMVDQFRVLHERQPLDGYDHLAAWLDRADLNAGRGPTGMQVLQGRVLESARRDPYQAVIGDQAAVQVAVASQQAADEASAAVAGSPSVDPNSSGMLPNPGPLSFPPDVTGVAPAVAEQQQAAAAQSDEGNPAQPAPTGEATPPASAPGPSVSSSPAGAPVQDAPASTSTPPGSDTAGSPPAPGNGSKGKSGQGSSS